MVDQHRSQGNTELGEAALVGSTSWNEASHSLYDAMEAHGHPDFPAALRQQRQNYNPRNSGYRP
jgi:hypothetical protein